MAAELGSEDASHAHALIRTVARAFYQTRHILVIDALMRHSTLWVDDLATVLSMNTKELRKLCSILRDDKLVSVHTRQEIKEGQTRPQNKDYYFVDYHLAIDAIKLRIVRLEKKVRDLYKPTQERKEWHCIRCKGQFTEMEVLHKFDPMLGGFACINCAHLLDRNEVSAADRAGSERSSRLMSQLAKLVGPDGLLRKIDENDIPRNDFETALARQVPIERSATNPGAKWEAVKKEHSNETVHGVKIEAPEIQVSFTTQQETEKEEAEKKRQRLEQMEKNALPAWHTTSTITGQASGAGAQDLERIKKGKESIGAAAAEEPVESKPAAEDNEYMLQYYKELEEAEAAQRARQEEQDAEDDDEDEDEEDEFENVVAADTPASNASMSVVGTKRKAEDSDIGSGVNTGVSTPAVTEESPSKRIKLEDGAAEEEDDDDDEEFEDAI